MAKPGVDTAVAAAGSAGVSPAGVSPAQNPAEVYAARLEALLLAQSAEQRRELRLGYVKVALVIAIVVPGALFFRHALALELLLIPIAAFVVAAVVHDRVLRSIGMRARAIRFYEGGMARVEDRWAGTGETGERFLDAAHAYARDLDVFGKASVFELLCTARTRAGEETLAAWLLQPAEVEEVRARQSAVEELRGRVEFRERLSTLAETVRLGVHPEAMAAWGERAPLFADRATRAVTYGLSALWVASLLAWGVWGLGWVAGAMTLVNLAWAHRIYSRLKEATDALETAAKDLTLLEGVLELVEAEKFSAAKLVRIQAALRRDGAVASEAIGRLARIAARLEHRHNPAGRWLDVVTFWTAMQLFRAERWQREFGPQIRGWVAEVGEFEALSSLAGYAYEHPQDVFAEFADGAALFEAEGLAHPLLPVSKAVRNDVRLGAGVQLMILSGPNMAGKSTFIRSIGVNAVLAQCGAPVRAARLRLTPLAVAASICILDSLSGGVSRFYAEIHRVKLISDLTKGALPVLFLLDELLSGTNSHDRLEGTQFVVRSLVERGAIGVVSTHDLALAKIPETMGGRAINCHFEDTLEEGRLVFDYTLKPGVVQTSNALELMRSIGLGVGTEG